MGAGVIRKGGGLLLAAGTLTVLGGMAAWKATDRWKKKGFLDGKRVLITGASRGLGLALAEEFGLCGAHLALIARDSEELFQAQQLLESKRRIADGRSAIAEACDLTNPQEAVRVIADISKHLGGIDILVNNAGIITVGPLENQTLQDFQNVMNSNFYSMLHCTLAVLPQMIQRGSGNIVNIASIGGKIAIPHLLPYTASKFAAVGFSQGLRAELWSKGVKVTTVCPGLMRTGSHLRALFTGNAEQEFRWFSLGASLPGISTTASHAAKRIVLATVRGDAELTITPQAWLAGHLANFVPETTAFLLRFMNDRMPEKQEDSQFYEGRRVRGKEVRPLTVLGEMAARRYRQRA
jgi:short-subunit dehydrogenase